MTVLMKKPGERAKICKIRNSLEALQRAVGGYIETVTFAENVVIICNEEGRLMGLPDNITLMGVSFVGPIIICGVEGEEFTDLPEDLDTVFGLSLQELLGII